MSTPVDNLVDRMWTDTVVSCRTTGFPLGGPTQGRLPRHESRYVAAVAGDAPCLRIGTAMQWWC